MTRSKSSNNVQSTYLLLAHIWNRIYIQQWTKQRWFLPSKGQLRTYLQDALHLLLAHWHSSEARIQKLDHDGEMKEVASHHLTCQRDSELQRRGLLDLPGSSGSIGMRSMTLAHWQVNFSPRFKESWQAWNHCDGYKQTRNSETSISHFPTDGLPSASPFESKDRTSGEDLSLLYYRWHMGPHKKLTGSKTSQTELVWTFEFLFFLILWPRQLPSLSSSLPTLHPLQ